MRRDLIAALVGGAVVLALAGSVAWAAIPGEGGVYTACMLKNIGTVRLIDKSLPHGNLMSRCKPALEIEVSWNREGPQGLQGIQGPKGDRGEQGIQGPQGEPGGLSGRVQVNDFGNVPAADPSDPFTTGFAVVTAACPPGTDALGGGGTGTLAGVVDAQRSGPSASGNGWDILYHNKSTTASIVVEVTAVCASTT